MWDAVDSTELTLFELGQSVYESGPTSPTLTCTGTNGFMRACCALEALTIMHSRHSTHDFILENVRVQVCTSQEGGIPNTATSPLLSC